MRRRQWLAVAALAMYAGVSVVTGARHALGPTQSQDLAPIYMAAKVWRVGQDPYAERSAEEWQRITGAGVIPAMPIERAYSTPYAPMTLLVVATFSGLDWPAARAVWLAINLGLAMYVPWLIHRLWLSTATAVSSAAFFAVWFGGMGLRVGLGNGQHALFWFASMLSVVWLMREGRPGWAGLPLAFSLYKYPLTVPLLPYFVLHRWLRTLAVGALATALGLALFAVGLHVEVADVTRSFLRELAWWSGDSGSTGLQNAGMTDFYPVLAAVIGPEAGRLGMYLVIGAATLAACWPVTDGRPIARGIDIAAVLLLMLTATYHRVYDTVVLIVPIVTLAAYAPRAAGWRRWGRHALVGLLTLTWYVDPSAVYRRIMPMQLEQIPETGLYVTLDLTYRLVIAAAFLSVVILRFQPGRAMTLVVESRAA